MGAARIEEVLPSGVPDSNVLVTGATLSNKEQIGFELLAKNWTTGATPFAITATDSARRFRSRFAPFVPGDHDASEAFVVDCTENSGSADPDTSATCTLETPADLTGIGICLSKGYDHFGTGGRRYVLLDNISTLLIYSEMDRVYRFLSTINNNVTDVGDNTVQLLDRDAVSEVDRNKLYRLFPTIVDVRQDRGSTMFRIRGDVQTDWYEYLPSGGEQ